MRYGKYAKRRNLRRSKSGIAGNTKKVIKKAVGKAKRENFARRVKQVLSRALETKVVNNAQQNRAIYNINASQFQGSVIPLGPGANTPYLFQIPQGTAQGQRIGDYITTKKLMMRGDVRINTSYNVNSNYNPVPGYVVMWVVKLKPFLNDDVSTLSAVINGSFFQSGNGSIGMTGQIQDLYRMPNNQQITVLKKRVWKVGNSIIASSTGNPNGQDTSNQQWANNDFGMTKIFKQDLTKYLPKKVAFNDSNDNFVNRRSYLFFTFLRIDGAIPQSSLGVYSGVVPAFIDFSMDYTFTDA